MTNVRTGPAYPRTKVRLPYAASGQRVGLYGGSFDPVHAGHALVAERAMRRLKLDWLWWLVTPGNPLKTSDPAHSLQARIDRVRAFAPDPRYHVLGVEEALGVRYTAETLAILTTMRPDLQFVWLMGADNLASFHNWNEWRAIAARMPIAVIDRPGARHAPLSAPAAQALRKAQVPPRRMPSLYGFPPRWVMLRGPLSGQSSTAIRSLS